MDRPIQAKKSKTQKAAEELPRETRLPGNSLAYIFLVFAVTFIAYFPALRGGYVWDDKAMTDNPLLLDGSGLVKIWSHPSLNPLEQHYWPLVYTSFWIERKLWGIHPAGYHAVNLLLHAVNSILVFLILRRLKVSGAAAAGVLFALHPAHVESVAWIIERKDVLSGFFYLLAFLTYLQFDEQRGIASYGGAMILFLAALLSKSVAVTLPVAIGIALWWKRGLGKRDLITLAPFAVLGVVFALFDSRLAHRLAGYDSHLSFAGRILVAMRATIFYGGKSFWPAPLTMNHPRWNMEAPSAGSVVLSVASILIPFLLWSARRRIGKGPLAAALFFGVTLGPTSGIIDHAFMNYSFVADRFQYLASIGPILIVAGIGEAAADRFGLKKPLAKIGVCLACLALASITWRRAETFRDTFSVFSDALRKNPDSWLAHFNLGREMEKTKDPASAADHYTKAVQLNPNFIEGFNNLGLLDLGQRRFAEAAEHFGRAIKLNPKFAKSWNNLGLLQLETGQFDQAAASFTHSLELKGEDSETLTNLGVVFSRSGKPAEAVPYLERAIKADPANVKAMNNLGSAFFTLGQPAKAEDYFRLAATARPDYVNAWVNLGSAQLQQGRGSEAAQSFQRALQLDPANPTAQAGLRQARPGSK